jgi:hypothetical protein
MTQHTWGKGEGEGGRQGGVEKWRRGEIMHAEKCEALCRSKNDIL